jgi:hypothetical protein
VYATGATRVWVQVAYYGPLARCRRFLFDFRVDYAAKVMGNEDSDFYQENSSGCEWHSDAFSLLKILQTLVFFCCLIL